MELDVALEKGDLIKQGNFYMLTTRGLWYYTVSEPFRYLVECLSRLELLYMGEIKEV